MGTELGRDPDWTWTQQIFICWTQSIVFVAHLLEEHYVLCMLFKLVLLSRMQSLDCNVWTDRRPGKETTVKKGSGNVFICVLMFFFLWCCFFFFFYCHHQSLWGSMLFWTHLSFIVWTKTEETFFKILYFFVPQKKQSHICLDWHDVEQIMTEWPFLSDLSLKCLVLNQGAGVH